MSNLYRTIIYIIIPCFIILSGCKEYNESEIIKNNNIKYRLVYEYNNRNPVDLEKYPRYKDIFNDSGYLIRRENFQYHDAYQKFVYDSSGKLLKEIPHNRFRGALPTHIREYLYDQYGNLIHDFYAWQDPFRYSIDYFNNDKIKSVFIYNINGKFSKIYRYNYNWLDYISIKLEINFDDQNEVNEVLKTSYKYTMDKKLLLKKNYEMSVDFKPVIKDNIFHIIDATGKNYTLKYTIQYIYNDIGLLQEEIKLNSKGYILGKTIYKYF